MEPEYVSVSNEQRQRDASYMNTTHKPGVLQGADVG